LFFMLLEGGMLSGCNIELHDVTTVV